MPEIPNVIQAWLPVILGALLLFWGRKLFWLCLAILGFFFTFGLVSELADGVSESLALFLAIGLGLLGALLAILLQRVAIGAAGFLFGGGATLFLIDFYALPVGGLELLLVLVGGIVAGLLAFKLFEIAILVLSSLVGASLLTGAGSLGPGASEILFVVLAILGIAVQMGSKRRRLRTKGKD